MRKHVLIVDDDQQIAFALRVRLEAKGYRITTAGSGRAGLQAAASETPDAIVLDIRMPDMDGYEVCTELRQSPATAAVPVIFLSAHSQEAFRRRAQEAGGDKFIAKPYRAEEIVHAIEELTAFSPPTPDLVETEHVLSTTETSDHRQR